MIFQYREIPACYRLSDSWWHLRLRKICFCFQESPPLGAQWIPIPLCIL